MNHYWLRPAVAIAAFFVVSVCCAEELKYPRTEIEVGYGHETLTNNGLDWRVTHLDLSRQIADRHTIYGGLRDVRRFGLADTEATAGFYTPLGAAWTAVVEASVSRSSQFLPKYTLFAQLHKAHASGWGTSVGLRHSEYERSAVDILSATAERYWGNWRGDFIGVNYTTGREVENVGPPTGVRSSDVNGWSITGRHWFSRAWALTYDLVSHEQGTLYRRQGLRVGVRHSF